MISHPHNEPSTSQIEGRGRTRWPATVWLTAAFAAALAACGSTSQEPIPTESPAEAQAPAIEEPVAAPPEAEQDRQPTAEASGDPAELNPGETSGNQSGSASAEIGEVDYSDTVWAPGDEGVLMKGLDGGQYQPYLSSVIEQVQTELKPEFYDGPVTGVLDEETMRAVGEFQKQNDLHVSGVPSPYTREKLLQDEGAAST